MIELENENEKLRLDAELAKVNLGALKLRHAQLKSEMGCKVTRLKDEIDRLLGMCRRIHDNKVTSDEVLRGR